MAGYIYILTNPSFPEYVKIGYADDVDKRLAELNRSECIPFAFRLYATYKVHCRLTDVALHNLIDGLNPNLRSIETYNGKTRIREFYNMSATDAYSLLENVAKINGLEKNLTLVEASLEDIKQEEEAEEIRAKRSSKTMPKLSWMIEQGILKPGDRIYVISHPEEKATVIDGKTVEYNGERMAAHTFGEKVTGWKAIQIYSTMKVERTDKTLGEMRRERMQELGMLLNEPS